MRLLWLAFSLLAFAAACPYLLAAAIMASQGGEAILITVASGAGFGWLVAGALLYERSHWRRG